MIKIETSHLPVAAISHPGISGKENEDRYGVSAFRMRGRKKIPSLLAVLSDGIGGHNAGEVAAEMAVRLITQSVGRSRANNPLSILENAIHRASRGISESARGNTALQGMGATCTAAWIIGHRLYAATVGDSRLYLLRGGGIHQLSTDHTWVQEAVDNGLILPGEARNHPNAHVIRRYLGSPELPEVDMALRGTDTEPGPPAQNIGGFPLKEGDRLVLCSDGLTDLVDDAEIYGGFNDKSLDEAVGFLVDLANLRGGHDNITIIAIQVPESPTTPIQKLTPPKRQALRLPWKKP